MVDDEWTQTERSDVGNSASELIVVSPLVTCRRIRSRPACGHPSRLDGFPEKNVPKAEGRSSMKAVLHLEPRCEMCRYLAHSGPR